MRLAKPLRHQTKWRFQVCFIKIERKKKVVALDN
jgi:hypothetical protein